MLWIGLTGSMGSGKSTVAKVLREMGFAVIDADQVVHDLMKPGTPLTLELIATFGPSVAGEGGAIDRPALGRVVFADRTKLIQLERMIHPKVREEVARRRAEFAAAGEPCAFYDVPLLYEQNMEAQFDFVLVVSAPEDVRRERLKLRSKISDAEITARFKSQLPQENKDARASAVIMNSGAVGELAGEVRRALEKIGVSARA